MGAEYQLDKRIFGPRIARAKQAARAAAREAIRSVLCLASSDEIEGALVEANVLGGDSTYFIVDLERVPFLSGTLLDGRVGELRASALGAEMTQALVEQTWRSRGIDRRPLFREAVELRCWSHVVETAIRPVAARAWHAALEAA